MRVVVTGGTGFVGRPTVAALIAAGYDVHVLARAAKSLSGATVHAVDLMGYVAPTLAAIRPDALLHLAWYAEPGRFWTAPENLDWVAASLRLVRAFALAGGRRLLGIGTCAEYDWQLAELDEATTPLKPHTLYGTAKAGTFAILAAAAETLDLSFAWGRIFFPYGPDERSGRLFSSVVDCIAAEMPVACSLGLQTRDFMHVDDVSRALVSLLASDVTGAVNIAHGTTARVRDFIELAATAAGRPDLICLGTRPPQPGEPDHMAASTRRLRAEVGFTPFFSLADGITDAVRRRLAKPGSVAALPFSG